MGTFQDKYYIIQIWDYPESIREKIKEFDLFLSKIRKPYKSLFGKFPRITNGGIDYFVGYSGSKEYWNTNETAKKIIQRVFDKIKKLNIDANVLEITPRGGLNDEDCLTQFELKKEQKSSKDERSEE